MQVVVVDGRIPGEMGSKNKTEKESRLEGLRRRRGTQYAEVVGSPSRSNRVQLQQQSVSQLVSNSIQEEVQEITIPTTMNKVEEE